MKFRILKIIALILFPGKVNIQWTKSLNVKSYKLNFQSLKGYPLNITFLNEEKKPTAFQILLTILNVNSTIETSEVNNWVVAHKLEYIKHFVPFSIFWGHHVANVYVNILNIFPLTSSGNDVTSVLSIYYQIMELPLETVPDRRTRISLNGVGTFVKLLHI